MRKSKPRTGDDLDRRLAEETRMLRRPIQAPGLWNRIEEALKAEAETSKTRPSALPAPAKNFHLIWLLIPAAAGAAFILALAVLPPRPSDPASGLLDRRALARVDSQEKEYIRAIDDLEKRARPKISAMDRSLMSLYKDRLALIDAQIDKCREALEQNPSSAHIRRYLLAALQDKKQTLAEALGT
jgi:hypothetical protein